METLLDFDARQPPQNPMNSEMEVLTGFCRRGLDSGYIITAPTSS